MATRDIAASQAPGIARPRLEAASPRYGEKAVKAFLALCAGLSVAVTTAIVVSLLIPTVDFFQQVSPVEFLTGTEWAPAFAAASFGVVPLVVGTLSVVFWALIVAIPVGLLSAIYLAEYAPRRVRKVVKPMLEVLEGIPTVAIGLFALLFLRPLAEDVLPFLSWRGPFSVGVAGFAVGLMIVPLVASISDDAMRSVPSGLREGAYALGATKMKVSARVVFPAAISGIVASIVLATSRAIGETMVVLIAAGATPAINLDPTRSVQTMTAFIGQTATGDIATGTITYNTIFAVGALLFVMTLVMNMVAIRLVRRFREAYE
ncbi:MAG TPA: phosphate ABC transporter permease subunit PstC [Gaiellaceae bacterium]|nr:phosphate ABC transporter permease subunit PstC [Gaiellaceae bacterium]